MNRAMRRDEHGKNKIKYNMSQQQVKDITIQTMKEEIKKAKEEGAALATRYNVAAFAMALEKIHGFKRKRLQRVMEEWIETCRCLEANVVSLEDLTKYCNEELKIDIL